MNDNKESNFIRQVLTTEVKYVIAIVGFVLGVVRPYYQMQEHIALIQKDISIINSNHEAHIQDILQGLKEQKQAVIELQKQIIIISKN